jgi:mannose-6-phosphate isomerase-like protein (cupin superfamily)
MFGKMLSACAIVLSFGGCLTLAADGPRRPNPYFLRRSASEIQEKTVDISATGVHYRPMYGDGDTGPRILRGVVRFGELTVDPGGASALVSYPEEEQIYFVLEGAGTLLYGDRKVPLKGNDFVYLPVELKHGVSNSSKTSCRLLVMGFHIPGDMPIQPTPRLLMANVADVKIEATHGPGTKFKLLLGDKGSTRDKLVAAHIVTSLFQMEFDPGINNNPHAHDMEEEIYYVLRGSGEMATGAGPTATEGRYPVKAGDVYIFRVNATVGFYRNQGGENPLILAVRSQYPFRKVKGTWSPMELLPEPQRRPH